MGFIQCLENGVYSPQLQRYSCACISDEVDRGLLLSRTDIEPRGFWWLLDRLMSSLSMFCGRYHDLVNRYRISLSEISTHMFRLSFVMIYVYYRTYITGVT